MEYMQHFERMIEALFNEYVPGKTYKILDDIKAHVPGPVHPVQRLPTEHVSAFTSADAEYKYHAVIYNFTVVTNGYERFVFRRIVDRVLTTTDYTGQLSMSFGILYALLVGTTEYTKLTGNTVDEQDQFIALYMENLGDMEETMSAYHWSIYGQDSPISSSASTGLHCAA